jgi:hypothetical protein
MVVACTSRHARAATTGSDESDRIAKNSVYAEGLGPGVVYSLDYDRVIGAFAGRAGVGVVVGRETSSSGSSKLLPLLLTIPITVSYVGGGTDWDMFEAGAGLVVTHVAPRVSTAYVKERQTATTTVLGTVFLGYRYQPPSGGFMFRVGASALAGRYGVLPLWPYLALGAAL